MCRSDTPKERKNSEPDWAVRFDHPMESIREAISSQGWVSGAYSFRALCKTLFELDFTGSGADFGV
jgi:hypothetical protein